VWARRVLGRGAIVEEVEQGLVGMNAGDTKEISFELADGSTQSLSATVKEIKEKVLPPLDDDLARAATEFETFVELRADIETRLRDQIEDEGETRFRADAADALVVDQVRAGLVCRMAVLYDLLTHGPVLVEAAVVEEVA